MFMFNSTHYIFAIFMKINDSLLFIFSSPLEIVPTLDLCVSTKQTFIYIPRIPKMFYKKGPRLISTRSIMWAFCFIAESSLDVDHQPRPPIHSFLHSLLHSFTHSFNDHLGTHRVMGWDYCSLVLFFPKTLLQVYFTKIFIRHFFFNHIGLIIIYAFNKLNKRIKRWYGQYSQMSSKKMRT